MHSCFRAGPVISKVDSFWVIADHVTWNRLSTSSQRTFWSGIDYWVTMFPLSSTLVKSADCAFRRRQKRVWCRGATWIALSEKTLQYVHWKSLDVPQDSWPEHDSLVFQLRGWWINGLYERWKVGFEGFFCLPRRDMLEFRPGVTTFMCSTL